MKNNFSFIEKYSFKSVLYVCLAIVFMDVLHMVKTIFIKQDTNIIPWFPFAMGVILISMAVINIKYTMEKIGIAAFGIALILNPFIKSCNYQVAIFILIISIDIIGVYCFWLANKAYNKQKKKIADVLFSKENRGQTPIFTLIISWTN